MPDFCQHCAELPGELKGTPSGDIKDVAGVPTYVTKSQSGSGSIILATDIYGLGITNAKIVADTLAQEAGITVYAPDYFKGDPMKTSDFVFPKSTEEDKPSEDQMGANMKNMGEWVQKGHGPDVTYPMVKSLISELSSKGSVGIVGFCYGGKIAGLAAQDGNVKGAAIYHAAMLEESEADNVKVPVLLNMADWDPTFNGVEEAWQAKLKEKNLLDSRSKKYSKTIHGFGSRPDQSKPEIMEAYKEALSNTAEFFKKTLA
jgi:carboxymethylenebutenolidase